ncbi:RNA polymerase sigma factor [Aquiflexum gelatinilyticum]|uniref:RNA polymerase sigma factor n=1 Tax=Aquiflexum gelatinilyticum TaxID=2961943 RepID=A0A9X2P8H8_9BACT|nr:RNA polymerase sigma factor [Aquiflexum gelatinilyticum]MCR9015149.1 RNA polymerase sigma factor [Aquiflexum gelatinilyticum]
MKTFFEAHIWSLKNKLYRMAFLWVKDRDVAQDVLQVVFEKAWLRKEELQKMENPVGWMVTSLKNESLQHFRNAKKFEVIGDFDMQSDEGESPDKSEEVKMVFRFLESIPEKQREIFQLREVEGLTYEEIAEYLEISMDQVKVNLHRARKTLKEYLLEQRNEK